MGMRTRRTDVRRLAEAVESLAPKGPRRPTSLPERKEPRPLLMRARVALYCSAERSRKATAARRTFPIMAYVGPNGGGKTLCCVKDSLPALRAGRRVVGTLAEIRDPATGKPFPNYEPLRHADQLFGLYGGELLLDEMVGVASSRESLSLDPRIALLLNQLRKRGVLTRWTAPNYARADKIVREVTQSVTECRGYYALRPKGGEVDELAGVQVWAPKRLFHFRTFDTVEFEEWTTGKRDKAEPEISEWYYAPAHSDRDAYDTLGAVELVAGMARNGECPHCGGARSRPRCKCTPDEIAAADAAAELAENSAELAEAPPVLETETVEPLELDALLEASR